MILGLAGLLPAIQTLLLKLDRRRRRGPRGICAIAMPRVSNHPERGSHP